MWVNNNVTNDIFSCITQIYKLVLVPIVAELERKLSWSMDLRDSCIWFSLQLFSSVGIAMGESLTVKGQSANKIWLYQNSHLI